MALTVRRISVHRLIPALTNCSKNKLLLRRVTSTFNMSEQPKSQLGIKLSKVIDVLEKFANPKLAEKWDNVGLLIEPATSLPIENIMLTNDLTEVVLQEAIINEVNLIVSYHPPIFVPLKRITNATWKERIVALCLENRIAVYSPHTSWDAVYGGVADWLGDAFKHHLEKPDKIPLVPSIFHEESGTIGGMGRLIHVSEINLQNCIDLIKSHIRKTNLRIAFGKHKTVDSPVNSIALVPGSGGSLLKGVNADLYVTGEMFHHDLLDANHNGTSVILTNHSDSERGFLDLMRSNLEKHIKGEANIIISQWDKDPLTVI